MKELRTLIPWLGVEAWGAKGWTWGGLNRFAIRFGRVKIRALKELAF